MAKHKYGAVATVVDGIRFASKAEAKRYGELRLLEKAGEITRLTIQPRFELVSPLTDLRGDVKDPERVMCIGRYVADFSYDELTAATTKRVVEDVKGVRTELYKWKKRHFEAQYGIRITEIGK